MVAEIVFKQHVQDYLARHVKGLDLGPAYADAFRRYIDAWQDPDSGYWGPWYLVDGEVRKSTDLSTTYHIVAYRKGEVARWDRIIATTLALEYAEYPVWLALPGSADRPQRLRRGADLPARLEAHGRGAASAGVRGNRTACSTGA